MLLLIQYFKNGLVVADKKRKCLLNKIKVVMFQLMINMPTDKPTIAKLIVFTSARYSGARNNESAPNVFIKLPFTTLNKINQNSSNAWYFLKCRKSNCTGNE